MVLVPGMALTNAMREIMVGDIFLWPEPDGGVDP